MNRFMALVLMTLSVVGCATLTSDAMTPIAISFGDGTSGKCQLMNKRGQWDVDIPSTASVRRSDDPLKYQCTTKDGREASGQIASTVGAKIVASAVFIDFGITDAITDKHREYAASFVIPIEARDDSGGSSSSSSIAGEKDVYAKLEELNALREKGVITDAEFDAEKKKLLNPE